MTPLRDAPQNSRLAAGVTRLGFRKWYERELLRGHAHMVLALVSTIALLASMEAFRGGSVAEKLMDAAFVLLSAAIGLWAIRRYMFLLMRAEQIANQAVCPKCDEYGRFTVAGDSSTEAQTRVCCKKCAHLWVIDTE
jgi:hypothetical protein